MSSISAVGFKRRIARLFQTDRKAMVTQTPTLYKHDEQKHKNSIVGVDTT